MNWIEWLKGHRLWRRIWEMIKAVLTNTTPTIYIQLTETLSWIIRNPFTMYATEFSGHIPNWFRSRQLFSENFHVDDFLMRLTIYWAHATWWMKWSLLKLISLLGKEEVTRIIFGNYSLKSTGSYLWTERDEDDRWAAQGTRATIHCSMREYGIII